MAKRDDLYQKFGPVLFEAIVTVLLAETNRLRLRLSMPAVDMQDFITALENELEKLTPYDWMADEEMV